MSQPKQSSSSPRGRILRLLGLASMVTLSIAAGAEAASRTELAWRFSPTPTAVAAVPPLPSLVQFPVQLVLDDDAAEGTVGVAGSTARQFLWFNRFTPGGNFDLEETWVLFPSGDNMAVGAAVQIAVYQDADGNPANGAVLLATFNETIQAVDGNTFSIYSTPVSFDGVGDLLIGVVPRFIVSGVTTATGPAALDTTASQGRSWMAIWSTDPPNPPSLTPPPDVSITTVDGFLPGNWMIRGFGTQPPVVTVPTMGEWGLILLALALALAAAFVLRRRSLGVASLVLLALGLAGAAEAQVTIDSFTTNQATLSAPPTSNSSALGGADIIGTRRGLVAANLLGAGPTTAGVAGGNLTLNVTATTPDSRGEARLSWDGDANPLVLAPAGLGSVNLTASNSSGFRIRVVSTSAANAELVFTVHSGIGNSSRASRLLPLIGAATNVFLPFSEFRTAAGTGASFTAVGAIELTVRATETTVVIDEIVTSAPVVAATKVDTQINDTDGDTRVDPGDRLRYTITVTNTGNEALNVALTDTLDPNLMLVAGSVSATPIARNDQYTGVGNVTLNADGTPPGLLANDADPDGDTVTVQSVVSPSTRGGTVSLTDPATGTFTYSPPAGFKGVDTFNYTIVDDNGNTSTATVTITLDQVVWFVDDSNTTPPHLGTLADPFQVLANVSGAGGAGDADLAGDIIFVFDDDGTPYAGGIELEADQTLIGEAAGLILNGETIVPAGGRPQITNAAGVAVLLATNDTLRGFDVQGSSGAGIMGLNFGTLTVTDLNVLTTGGATLNLDTGNLAATIGTLSSTGGTQRGVLLDTVTGTLTVTTTSLTNPLTHGIRVVDSPAFTADFGNTTITDNAIGTAPAATGIDIATSAGASITFDSLALTTDGAGLVAASSGTINIGGTGNTIVATGGAAADLTTMSLGSGATFSTLSSTNSTGKGVNLDTLTGAFTANGGSITGAAGITFDLNGGSANVTYAGSLTNVANVRLIEVTARTGGTTTFSGNLSGTSNSNGINVASNTGGTILFSGTTKTLNTGADAAVTLATNTGATIAFTGGNLDIDTTSGSGFTATGGAAAITVQGTNNTITSTTGTALNVANSTIGSSGLTFQSISANGAANGITLSSTGTTGGFTITGTGSAGSGGTIQSITNRGASFIDAADIELNWMNFTNAATANGGDPTNASSNCGDLNVGGNLGCNAPVHLVNISGIGGGPGAILNRLVINGSVQVGINVNNVNGLTISNTTLTGIGNQVREFGLKGRNLLGTVSLSSLSITGSFGENLRVENNTGSTTMTVTGSTFNSATEGGGFFHVAQGTAVTNVNISTSTFSSNFTTGLLVGVSDPAATGSANLDVTGGTFSNNNAGIQVIGAGGADVTFDLLNIPTISGNPASGIAMDLSDNSTSAGSLVGTISGNTITMPNTGAGNGIGVTARGAGTTTVAVTGNNITNRSQYGIHLHRKEGLAPGTLNATVTGNTVTTVDVAADTQFPIDGIRVEAGAAAADTGTVCAHIASNTATGANSVPAESPGDDIRLRHRFTHTFRLPGLVGSTGTDADNHVTALNPGATLVSATTTTSFTGGASCPVP